MVLCNNSGQILFLEINIYDSLFVVINIYKANNETDLLKTLTDLGKILHYVDNIQNKNIISRGDFNLIFDSFLKLKGRNQVQKIIL